MSYSTYRLNTGATIPSLALGTWQSKPGEVAQAVEHALKEGYDHIDAAWCYGNEGEVGQGITASGRNRKEIFITGKLWSTFHTDPERNLDESLKMLGIDYLDLYLIHWPIALNPDGNSPILPTRADGSRDLYPQRPLSDTWKAMEALLNTGKVKAIGVCNMSQSWMERLLKTAVVTPAVNQVELHPLLPQSDLIKYCQSKGITVEAYSPLGSASSPALKDQVVISLAEKYECSPSQVVLSWNHARGVVVLPKSVNAARICQNAKLVHISEEDVQVITRLTQEPGKTQRFVRPAWGVDLGFEDW